MATVNMQEAWAVCPGFPDYLVSTDGNFMRATDSKSKKFRAGYRLKVFKNKNTSYGNIVLVQDGKPRPLNAHRLVALAFIPNPGNLKEVDHINSDRMDNRVANLRWLSSSENTRRHCAKQVYVIDQHNPVSMAMYFATLADAADFYGIHPQGIGKALRSGRPFKKGRYLVYKYKGTD